MQLDLDGKNVFSSGSSGGSGSAAAEAFLEEGARVVLHGLDAAKLEARRAVLTSKFPDRVSAVAADLTDPAGRDAAVEAVRASHGTLDAAVFCVGNGNVAKGFGLTQAQWDPIFAQNFFANAHMASALAPMLKKGSLCFIGSIA